MADHSRRAVLAAGLGALLGVPFVTAVDEIFLRIVDSAPQPFGDADAALFNALDPIDAENLRLVRDLISDRGDVVKVVGGKAHHQYPERIHPDDQWACETILDVARRGLSRAHQLNVADDFGAEGSFACTGSPVSNDRARAFLQYSSVDADRPKLGLRRDAKPRLDLAFEYMLERDTLRERGLRHREAEKGKANPNWSIRSRSGELLSPSTVAAETDYLLISRVPNWIEGRQKNRDFNNVVTVFGGCHGVGTSAIRLLFDDLRLLKRLELVWKQHEFWQAIVKISVVERRKHPKSGTIRPIAVALSDQLVAQGRVTPLKA